MPQVSQRKMKPELEINTLQVFIDVLTSTFNSHSQSSFVELFMTPTEKIMFSKRVAIAILIKRGYSYELIKDFLKVSQSTIAKIVNQLAISTKSSQDILDTIIRNKQASEIVQRFEYFLGGMIPPKGRDWVTWRKNLEKAKRISHLPI